MGIVLGAAIKGSHLDVCNGVLVPCLEFGEDWVPTARAVRTLPYQRKLLLGWLASHVLWCLLIHIGE